MPKELHINNEFAIDCKLKLWIDLRNWCNVFVYVVSIGIEFYFLSVMAEGL